MIRDILFMLLLSNLFYRYLFFWLLSSNFLLIIGSDLESKKLFFPAKSKQLVDDSDDRLVKIRNSFEMTEGKARGKYLDALVAEINEKKEQADELSMQAYQEYLLSKPYGSLIQKQGSVSHALWNLLSKYPLNHQMIIFLQNLLEGVSTTALTSCDFFKLEKIINEYADVSLDVEHSRYLSTLKEVLAVQRRMSQLTPLCFHVRDKIYQQENVCKREIFQQFLDRQFIIENFSKDAIFKKLSQGFNHESFYRSLHRTSPYKLLLCNAKESVKCLNKGLFGKSTSPQNFDSQMQVVLRRLDNRLMFTQVSEKILEKNPCLGHLSTRTTVKVGCFNSDELSDVDLSGVEGSFIDQNMKSKIIVLTGHTDTGDVIELINFPQENKLFARIEIINRTNSAPIVTTQEPTTTRSLVSFEPNSTSFESRKNRNLNDDDDDDLSKSTRF